MMKKRMLGMVLAAAMVLGTAPGSIGEANAAAARTRDEAVAWANAQVGNGLDYDGMYGNQCVDLVKYYYDYFGVAKFAKGNANAYADNRLPSGWSRVYGDYQPGDIAVWKTNHKCGTCNTTEYGHVGIITSADSVGFNAVTQNDMNTPYCTQKLVFRQYKMSLLPSKLTELNYFWTGAVSVRIRRKSSLQVTASSKAR